MDETRGTKTVEAIPVLPSLDFAETGAFYRERLGFREAVHEGPDYLILRRDAMELHFWLTPDRALCENASVYLRGGDIDTLYAEYEKARVPGLSPFTVRPWAMKEFYIRDPHGNLLRFGRIPLDGETG